MNIREIVTSGINVSRRNYQIFIPPVVAALVAGLIDLIASAIAGQRSIAIDAAAGPADVLASAFTGQALWATMLFGALSAIILLLGHGMTIVIAHQVTEGNRANLKAAFGTVRERLIPLVIAAIIAGILVAVGAALMLLPGLIIAFLLLYTFVAVVAAGIDALGALKKSFNLVTRHILESIILFLVLLAGGVLFAIVSSILILIPAVGAILGLIVGGLYAGLASVMILQAYKSYESLPAPALAPATSQGSKKKEQANTQ